MRWFAIPLLIVLAACSTRRVVTITPTPADAIISVDGIPRGAGSLTEKFRWRHADDVHKVTASRLGYQEQTLLLTRDNPSTNYEIVLQPLSRRLNFSVSPVPAFIDIDGNPAGSDPVQSLSRDMPFTVDDQGNWTHYTVTASRPGFQPAQIVVSWTDPSADYTLQLQPMRKDLNITTNPPGADITIDGQAVGKSPLTDKGFAFPYDVDSNQYTPHKLTAAKPGYEPYTADIAWDDGKTDYAVDLPTKKKIVHIATDPAGAIVTIDGKVLPPGDGGLATAELSYVPIDDKGDLPTFQANITKKTAETEWFTEKLDIPWDDGKTDYSITLKEVTTHVVPMLDMALARDNDGIWEFSPRETETIANKDINEGPGRQPPTRLYSAPEGSTIGSIAISPNGDLLLFTIVSGKDPDSFHSQILAINTETGAGVQEITDGKALDIMPSFTPAGDEIVFASNRAGKRLNIWQKSLLGGAGIEQLTNGQEQDLWPTVDAAPKPRLFYEALSDSQPDPELYVEPIESGTRMELSTIPSSQPRVSPKADSILFTSQNDRTANREIYRISDHGGPPENLTNDPDNDYFDPSWSRDANEIAFATNRGLGDDRRKNSNIWIIDFSHPDKPTQVTNNGSVDDSPVWDPGGDALYFRSNRGGAWGIWKIVIK
jgi:hypothetical protein